MKIFFVVLSIAFFASCGTRQNSKPTSKPPTDTQIDEVSVVVRSRANLPINVRSGKVWDASGTQPVTVVNAAAVSMTMDNSKFSAPTITNDLLDFGYLGISALRDNQLKVCGPSGNTKCTKAFIRMYTTGVAGAGLWNAVDGYGAPMTASLTTPLTVGLNVANAAILQTITIAANKRVVRLSDFTPTPNYNIKYDFTDAGAGSYSTTIVLEYALSL